MSEIKTDIYVYSISDFFSKQMFSWKNCENSKLFKQKPSYLNLCPYLNDKQAVAKLKANIPWKLKAGIIFWVKKRRDKH